MSERETPGLRASVEQRSAVLLVFLHQLPRWVPLVAAGGLLVLGLVGSGWPGALALLLLAAVLGWFAYLSWPHTQPPGRLLRVGALAVLVVIAAGHVTGQF